MKRTFRYRLYPTKHQIKCLEKTFNLCRFLYNCALEERISYYKKYNKSIYYVSQANFLPEVKVDLPEYKEIYSQVLQSTLKRVDNAYVGFFRRLKSGGKPGFPRFKNKNRFHSILYPQLGFGIKDSESKWTHLKLSRVGHIPMRFHRNISGKIKTCQIVRTPSGKWYACLSCDGVQKNPIAKTGKSIGIDLGIKNLVAFSDGNKISNPKHFKKTQRKLAAAQRRLAALSNKDIRRASRKKRVARLYEKTTNQRKDFYHKLSKNLVNEYDKIFAEKLEITEMTRNNWRNLNQEIQSAAWGELIHMLLYKAESADKEVVLVDPRNTSKMCSACGNMVDKDLSDRIHKCECGLVLDRDHNAAINILNRGIEQSSIPRESRNGFSESMPAGHRA